MYQQLKLKTQLVLESIRKKLLFMVSRLGIKKAELEWVIFGLIEKNKITLKLINQILKATLMTLDVDIKKLGTHLKSDLPTYAKPLFIRLNDQVEHTGSLKAQKLKLVEEGFNVSLFNDKTFYYDNKTQNYLELTLDIYEKIQEGSIRL